jgi:hypothetical protein
VYGNQLLILIGHFGWQDGVVKRLKDISLALGKDKLADAREKQLSYRSRKQTRERSRKQTRERSKMTSANTPFPSLRNGNG